MTVKTAIPADFHVIAASMVCLKAIKNFLKDLLYEPRSVCARGHPSQRHFD
jgi:hypothetical protein